MQDKLLLKKQKKHSKRNIITKCLGETEIVAQYVIDMGDDFVKEDIIMICSDGISDNLYDTEIKKILLNGMDKSLLKLCREICCKAIDNGSQDNLSIILIRKEEN